MLTKPRARIAIAAAFFLYVLLIRTYDLANSFLMIGEQIRDWRIALGSWTELPLTGAPSTAGGRGFGPVYYWLLWIGRQVVGPFTQNFPHGGGIWIALLQSVADTWLLLVLSRRVHMLLALATCLLIASGPFDISISGVIWNPPVSAALVKMATALALSLGSSPTMWRVAATAGVAWLGVQAHLSAIFVAAPLMAALVAQPLLRWNWRQALGRAGAIAGLLLVLQVPYFIARVMEPAAAAGPTAALNTMAQIEFFEPLKSYTNVVGITGGLLLHQVVVSFVVPVLVLSVLVLIRWRADLVLLAVSVGPIVGATVLFSTWTRTYDSYWFLTATTGLALVLAMSLAAVPWPAAAPWVGAAALATVAAWQPAHLEASRNFFSYPQYRAMRLGSIELARQADVLRDIRITFDAHPTMDKYLIFNILGGRIDRAAPRTGFIEADGRVRIE